MGKSKHTPGPWRVEKGTTVIWSDNAYDPGTNSVGCIVARAAQPFSWKGSRPTASEQDANCRLIATAPDYHQLAYDAIPILEAVLEDREEEIGEEDEILRDLLDRFRETYAKAEGRADA